jgi:fatty acid synthase
VNLVIAGGDHKFLADHVVDGRILMPATSYVVTAWEALCSMKSRKMEETPVAFEDVQIRQAVTAEEGQKIALAVLIAPDNRFNVSPPNPVLSHESATSAQACNAALLLLAVGFARCELSGI